MSAAKYREDGEGHCDSSNSSKSMPTPEMASTVVKSSPKFPRVLEAGRLDTYAGRCRVEHEGNDKRPSRSGVSTQCEQPPVTYPRRSRACNSEEMTFGVSSDDLEDGSHKKGDNHDLGKGAIGLDDHGDSSVTTGADLLKELDGKLLRYESLEHKYEKHRNKSHQKICSLEVRVQCLTAECDMLRERLADCQQDLTEAKSSAYKKDVENEHLKTTMRETEDKYSQKMLALHLELERSNMKCKLMEDAYGDTDEAGANLHSKPFQHSQQGSLKVQLEESMAQAHRLQMERDKLEQSKEDVERRLKDAEGKYQAALIDFNKSKIGYDAKVISLKSQLDVKELELNRQGLLLEEYYQKLQGATSRNESLKEKLNEISSQLNAKTCEMNEENSRLSLELESKSVRLEMYEKLEANLDEMIMTAASIPGDCNDEKVLSVCHLGNSLPTDAKRRLEQAFNLAKKNCELEKVVASQKEEILKSYDVRNQLREEISSMKASLPRDSAQLILTIVEKNRLIGKLNRQIADTENQLQNAKDRNDHLQCRLDVFKEYQNDLLKVYHSGATLSQAKQPEVREPAKVAPRFKNRGTQAPTVKIEPPKRRDSAPNVTSKSTIMKSRGHKNVWNGEGRSRNDKIKDKDCKKERVKEQRKIGSETESEIEVQRILATYKASSSSRLRRDGLADTISQTNRSPPVITTLHIARRIAEADSDEYPDYFSPTTTTGSGGQTSYSCKYLLEPRSVKSSLPLQSNSEEPLRKLPTMASNNSGRRHVSLRRTTSLHHVAVQCSKPQQSRKEKAQSSKSGKKEKEEAKHCSSAYNVPLRKSKVKPSKSVQFF